MVWRQKRNFWFRIAANCSICAVGVPVLHSGTVHRVCICTSHIPGTAHNIYRQGRGAHEYKGGIRQAIRSKSYLYCGYLQSDLYTSSHVSSDRSYTVQVLYDGASSTQQPSTATHETNNYTIWPAFTPSIHPLCMTVPMVPTRYTPAYRSVKLQILTLKYCHGRRYRKCKTLLGMFPPTTSNHIPIRTILAPRWIMLSSDDISTDYNCLNGWVLREMGSLIGAPWTIVTILQ